MTAIPFIQPLGQFFKAGTREFMSLYSNKTLAQAMSQALLGEFLYNLSEEAAAKCIDVS
jgi:hypothetical protein